MPEPATTTAGRPPQPLWGFEGCFDDPGIRLLLAILFGTVLLAGLVVAVLAATGRLSPQTRGELTKRTLAWAVMTPIVAVPILYGKLPTIVLFTVLSLLCYREFARATGFF